eukprot:GHVH01007238.1.p1 GENE.GHVH01007238.1~~GHVH01007238.1.p1  ORF type:complete len:377 (-),score=47.95 GHVH01007238.1:26-1156(-)
MCDSLVHRAMNRQFQAADTISIHERLPIGDRLVIDLWLLRTQFGIDFNQQDSDAVQTFNDLVDYSLAVLEASEQSRGDYSCMDVYADQISDIRLARRDSITSLVVPEPCDPKFSFVHRNSVSRFSAHPSGVIWDIFHSISSAFQSACAKSGTCSIELSASDIAHYLDIVDRVVMHIFRCLDCQEHYRFQVDHQLFDMESWVHHVHPESISEQIKHVISMNGGWNGVSLWMWRLHNAVNIRTAQDDCPEAIHRNSINEYEEQWNEHAPSECDDRYQTPYVCGSWRTTCSGKLNQIDPVWPERSVSLGKLRPVVITLDLIKDECLKNRNDPLDPLFRCHYKTYDVVHYETMYFQRSDVKDTLADHLNRVSMYMMEAYA